MPNLRINNLLLSFLMSLAFIWIVAYFFCDSPLYQIQDDTLKKMIHAPGVIYYHRSEGFAQTYKGMHGINAIPDISKIKGNKVAIWGDSYLEAHQVNDNEKIPQLLSQLLANKSIDGHPMSFGVGMSGDSVADYFFDIPRYEKIIPDIKAHFIIIASITDTLPDQKEDKRGVFKSNPMKLYEDGWAPKFQKIKKTLYNLRIFFIWEPFRSIIDSIKSLQLLPNRIPKADLTSDIEPQFTEDFLKESWIFLLEKLSKQTTNPIVFVYCPAVPEIIKGQLSYNDPYSVQSQLFRQLSENDYNIAVIDMTESFCQFFKSSGLFPRGFKNTKPGIGHLNKDGHRLVAEAIRNYIQAAGIR